MLCKRGVIVGFTMKHLALQWVYWFLSGNDPSNCTTPGMDLEIGGKTRNEKVINFFARLIVFFGQKSVI